MWVLKIFAKLVLSRLRVPYSFWRKVGIFRHGHMEAAEYVRSVFADHVKNAFPNGLPEGATVLELGVGDSLASALVARAYKARKVYLADVGRFARTDPEFYKSLAASLAAAGLAVPDIAHARTLSEILELCNAEYLTDGLHSLRGIPDQSVDLIWSQAVLEHVRKADFPATMIELRRILKPTGRASHVIDFKDHLAEALNNLRFPDRVWESKVVASSGFYTNRIQAPRMLTIFEHCGFGNLRILKEWRWKTLPTPRAALHHSFRNIPDADLLVSCIKVTMDRAP
jgi:SAM-dependent methyltransferase